MEQATKRCLGECVGDKEGIEVGFWLLLYLAMVRRMMMMIALICSRNQISINPIENEVPPLCPVLGILLSFRLFHGSPKTLGL